MLRIRLQSNLFDERFRFARLPAKAGRVKSRCITRINSTGDVSTHLRLVTSCLSSRFELCISALAVPGSAYASCSLDISLSAGSGMLAQVVNLRFRLPLPLGEGWGEGLRVHNDFYFPLARL